MRHGARLGHAQSLHLFPLLKTPPKQLLASVSQNLTIAAFVVTIALPVAGTVFGWDFYPRQHENRRFAEKPVLAETGLAGYPRAFEAYYEDHFGFRNTYIRRYRKLWPRISGKEDPRVLFGEENWLFFLLEGGIGDFVGANPFTEEQLGDWQRAVEDRTRWLARRNCAYFLMLAPNKPRVYPEFLPAGTRSQARPGRVSSFLAHMEEHSDAHVLYLLDALLEEKKDGLLYLPNDTHWNDRGSFVAHRAMVAELAAVFPGLTAVPEEAVTYTPVAWTGDLARMTDDPEKFEVERPQLALRDAVPIETRPVDFLPDPVRHANLLQLGPLVTRVNPGGKYRVVVFHDSFAEFGLKELLPRVFRETTFISASSDRHLLEKATEELRPEIVIELIVERRLNQRIDEAHPWFEPLSADE